MSRHHSKTVLPILLAAILGWMPVNLFARTNQTELVFVGSGNKDITAFHLDLATGTLEPLGDVANVSEPTFLAVAPDHKILYAVSEGPSAESSLINAFRINWPSGKLEMLDSRPAGGAGPCFVAADKKGKVVLVANYNSGSVSAFPIVGQGTLGPMSAFVQDQGSSINRDRQEGPHAHCIVTDPDNRFAFACDLGLDKVMIFRFDAGKGSLVANEPAFASVKMGAGPRHIAFHPNGKFAYVINEMASTLTSFSYDARSGTLSPLEDHSLLPKDFSGQSWAAEVAVHPSGRFVYASNRGDDSIVVFECDPATGGLTFVERDSTQGKTPRNFEIDPTGAFLLVGNQDSNSIVVFGVNTNTGHLLPTGAKIVSDKPECIITLKAPKHFLF